MSFLYNIFFKNKDIYFYFFLGGRGEGRRGRYFLFANFYIFSRRYVKQKKGETCESSLEQGTPSSPPQTPKDDSKISDYGGLINSSVCGCVCSTPLHDAPKPTDGNSNEISGNSLIPAHSLNLQNIRNEPFPD